MGASLSAPSLAQERARDKGVPCGALAEGVFSRSRRNENPAGARAFGGGFDPLALVATGQESRFSHFMEMTAK
jgi:hypothetical protein